MNKSLYFIECTCIKDCVYPNVEFHIGDVLYFNKKASSNEMYLWDRKNWDKKYPDEIYKYRSIGDWSYLPFTRQKKNAKKWQVRRYADWISDRINDRGEFNCVVKEIKLTYTEEEI